MWDTALQRNIFQHSRKQTTFIKQQHNPLMDMTFFHKINDQRIWHFYLKYLFGNPRF